MRIILLSLGLLAMAAALPSLANAFAYNACDDPRVEACATVSDYPYSGAGCLERISGQGAEARCAVAAAPAHKRAVLDVVVLGASGDEIIRCGQSVPGHTYCTAPR